MRYHAHPDTACEARTLYALIRPLLFALDAETSHNLTLAALRGLYRIPGIGRLMHAFYAARTPALPVRVMGLDFPNPVGLAAGLDKNAQTLRPLFDFGFGWLELGTVTPRAQPGNPKKRMFRLAAQQAIINRMGFNSAGLDCFIDNLAAQRRPGLLGINLGKNRDTAPEHALDDYLPALRTVYCESDYIAINISSPNTPGLRTLQDEAPLAALLAALKNEQTVQAARHKRYVPLALKIAPDLQDDDIDTIARLLLTHQFDAVIATNTTITRPGLDQEPLAQETGGLSGQPLRALSTHVIRRLYRTLQGRIPIIGVGGISSGEDAWEKLLAGADLVQVYSALIYQGPGLVACIVRHLQQKVHELGTNSLPEAVARARKITTG
jgi:dihydroorotate dehydrogenase